MAKLTPQPAVAGESQDGNAAAAHIAGSVAASDSRPTTASPLHRLTDLPLHRLTRPEPAERAAPPNDGLVRADGRSSEVVAFEQAVVRFFVDAADLLGVPKSVAAIYGICFASPEPLGFSEINERLEISSGSISQGLKVLRDVGALKISDGSGPLPLALGSLPRPQRARERFEPDMELRKLVSHFIEERLEHQLEAGKGRLDAIQASLPASRNGLAGELKGRIKALQTWHNKGRAVLPVIKTFLNLT